MTNTSPWVADADRVCVNCIGDYYAWTCPIPYSFGELMDRRAPVVPYYGGARVQVSCWSVCSPFMRRTSMT